MNILLYGILFLALFVVITFYITQAKRITIKKRKIISSRKKNELLSHMNVATMYEPSKIKIYEAIGENLLLLMDTTSGDINKSAIIKETQLLVSELNNILNSQNQLTPYIYDEDILDFFKQLDEYMKNFPLEMEYSKSKDQITIDLQKIVDKFKKLKLTPVTS